MTQEEENEAKMPQSGGLAAQGEKLPYRVELWDAATAGKVERVLARALNATLARAIFQAALTEHPERRITLRRGWRLMADSRQPWR